MVRAGSLLLLAVLVAAGCSSVGDDGGEAAGAGSDGLDLVTEPTVRAEVGQPVTVSSTVRDADPSSVEVAWVGLPPGGEDLGTSARWTPDDAGRRAVAVTATDPRGRTTAAYVVVESRYPPRPHAVVGVGDSVASGHGLQRRDYLGRDDCWRAEDEAYPRRVFDDVRQADGAAAPSGAAFALVACSGARASELLDEPVGGGIDGTSPEGSDLSQVEWAVRANPGVVTVTVGANDLGFSHPERLLTDDGHLDLGKVRERLEGLEEDLTRVLERLVGATDAQVVVTTYHDPTADDPQGVDGCEGACFAAAARDAVGRLNRTIGDVAGRFPDDRVRLADPSGAFEGHGAPNGIGPDGLREIGFGSVGDLLGLSTDGVHPYCARGDSGGGSWISSVDCVHPNAAGAAAYAAAVLAALDA